MMGKASEGIAPEEMQRRDTAMLAGTTSISALRRGNPLWDSALMQRAGATTEETEMPKLHLLLCAGMLGLLAACGGVRTDASEPTVSYSYDDDDDYEEVAEKEDDYCEEQYDKGAYLVDPDSEDGDYEATFACR